MSQAEASKFLTLMFERCNRTTFEYNKLQNSSVCYPNPHPPKTHHNNKILYFINAKSRTQTFIHINI